MSQVLPCVFVQPEIVRLHLPNGHFIDVKRELNAGESRQVFAGMVKNGVVVAGERPSLDPERVGIVRIMAYLVGWSFTDADGRPIPLSEAGVDNLFQHTYRDVIVAIDNHENEQEARRELERKNPDGASGLRAIS